MFFETPSQKVFKVFNYTILTLLGFATFYPFWYVLIASFNLGSDFTKGGVYFWPRAFTLENYSFAFQDNRIYRSLGVTIFKTIMQLITSLFFTALLAYALSVKTMPGRIGITFFYYFTTMFGGGMIPYYILLRDLGLTKSIWLYIIPAIYGFFNMVLLRTAFATIPSELREAAQIDGAGDLRILFTIYIPCALPTVATLALFIGVGAWNDWFTGAYYQSNKNYYPAATVLQQLLNEATDKAVEDEKNISSEQMETKKKTFTSQSIRMAFVMILTMPIIVIYPFLQKYYVKGVMVGSVKG